MTSTVYTPGLREVLVDRHIAAHYVDCIAGFDFSTNPGDEWAPVMSPNIGTRIWLHRMRSRFRANMVLLSCRIDSTMPASDVCEYARNDAVAGVGNIDVEKCSQNDIDQANMLVTGTIPTGLGEVATASVLAVHTDLSTTWVGQFTVSAACTGQPKVDASALARRFYRDVCER